MRQMTWWFRTLKEASDGFEPSQRRRRRTHSWQKPTRRRPPKEWRGGGGPTQSDTTKAERNSPPTPATSPSPRRRSRGWRAPPMRRRSPPPPDAKIASEGRPTAGGAHLPGPLPRRTSALRQRDHPGPGPPRLLLDIVMQRGRRRLNHRPGERPCGPTLPEGTENRTNTQKRGKAPRRDFPPA